MKRVCSCSAEGELTELRHYAGAVTGISCCTSGYLTEDSNGPGQKQSSGYWILVVGRKNWLFCDSVKGVESSAIVYPLVETAKANGIEPYEYLMLVLSMLPYLGKSPAHEELEKLMPWHPAVRHREHIRK